MGPPVIMIHCSRKSGVCKQPTPVSAAQQSISKLIKNHLQIRGVSTPSIIFSHKNMTRMRQQSARKPTKKSKTAYFKLSHIKPAKNYKPANRHKKGSSGTKKNSANRNMKKKGKNVKKTTKRNSR